MKVTVLSQDALTREGMLCLLAHQSTFRVVGGIENVSALADALSGQSADLLIVDGGSLSSKDWGVVKDVKKGTKLKVVVATTGDSKPAGDVADATFPRSGGSAGLYQAMREAAGDGGLYVRETSAPFYGTYPRMLTPREHEVAQLVSQGMPNRRIAQTLGLREQSIKNLVSTVMRKLDCENRVQVALRLTQRNK